MPYWACAPRLDRYVRKGGADLPRSWILVYSSAHMTWRLHAAARVSSQVPSHITDSIDCYLSAPEWLSIKPNLFRESLVSGTEPLLISDRQLSITRIATFSARAQEWIAIAVPCTRRAVAEKRPTGGKGAGSSPRPHLARSCFHTWPTQCSHHGAVRQPL